MVESRSSIQREGVYRWFSALTSAQRVEFLCGLLDLCIPIELRFLGSCLEDLARKDYHSLRDAEIKANNPTDLSGLTNITDEVVRSKLLVSLALLGSDNREAAGVLYRTLTHIDTVINNYGLALNDGRTEEQFLLLFTMASNHPAFSFHQKQVLRQQLSQIQDILQVSGKEATEAQGASADCPQQNHHPNPLSQNPLPPDPLSPSVTGANATYLSQPACQPCHSHCTCWHKTSNRDLPAVGQGDQNPQPDVPPPSPVPPAQPAAHNQDTSPSATNHQSKTTKVIIERVVLRGVTHRSEDTSEFIFETQWSDGLVSSVVRTEQEVTELLTQLSQTFSDEEVEKFVPQNMDPRCLSALPSHMLQHHSVQLFFTATRPLSPTVLTVNPSPLPSAHMSVSTATTCSFTSSPNPGFMVQHKGVNRAVYKVASVLPVVSTHTPVMPRPSIPISSLPAPLPVAFPHPQHSLQLPPLPPPHSGSGDPPAHPPAQHQPVPLGQPQSYPQHHLPTPTVQTSSPLPHSQSHSQTLSFSHFHSRTPSHQLPPAQSQAPEQNGILDWLRKLRLHKYYPVFKQLTMEEFLALTEEDLNKYDLTQGAKKKLKTQLELQKSVDREMKMEKRLCSGIARVTPSSYTVHHPSNSELRVEVEAGAHHVPVSTDSSSSSGYSSSPCSPRTPLCCESSFDRTIDFHRRVPGPDVLGASPEKDRSTFYVLNSSCPTGSTRPTAQVLPVQTNPPPPPPFSVPQNPFPPQASFPQQSRLSPLSNPARIMTSPRKPRPNPLPPADDRSKPLSYGASLGPGVGVGVRLETLFPGLSVDGSQQDSVVCRGHVSGAVGLMVETSSALTSTSNSHHHVSHPPVHFHLSSSSPPTASGPYSCPLVSSCPSTKSQTGLMATGSTAHRNNYYPPTSSPSPSAPTLDCGPADHTPSACVCSSCGCRGNCGAYGTMPGYATAGYLQQFTPGPSLFTLGPLLQFSPLIASSSSPSNGATPFPYPMMVPNVYRHGPQSTDPQQTHYFGMLGNVGPKQVAGNLSCYNCGANGHRADDCKQPSMDSAQQGMFRLKYTTHSDTKDSGD